MYLFVSEYNYSENTDAFSLTGQYLETSKQLFPKLSGLKAENIEKIVIYSCSNAYTDENITEAECQSIETNDNYIKITYGQKSPSDVTCGKVKSNLYHLLLQNGTLKNTRFTPYLTLIEGQNDYTKITSGKLDSNFTAHSEKIEKLKLNNDWNGIINYLSGLEGAVKTELWSTPSLLSELAYALSQSIFKSKNPQKEDIEYFYRVSDECMRLDGNNYSIKSVRAYFHYNSYLKSRKESDYAEARRYYTELIEKSPGKYKEFYRYTKLKQKHFSNNEYNAEYDENASFTEISDSFEKLIRDYDNLDEDRKKRYKNCYISSLFGYATFNLNPISKYYWSCYYNNKMGNFENVYQYIPTPYGQSQRDILGKIGMCAKYLGRICDLVQGEKIYTLKRPTYFEIQYRLAQLKLVMGIVYALKGKDAEKQETFFKDAFEISNAALLYAKEKKKRGTWKGNYPHYIKSVKAKALYFLGENEECHECFYNAADYMLYEQGQIYALCNDFENAIAVLKKIKPNNICCAKAQNLIEELKIREA